MGRIFNFSAGPSVQPESVLEQAAAEAVRPLHRSPHTAAGGGVSGRARAAGYVWGQVRRTARSRPVHRSVGKTTKGVRRLDVYCSTSIH